MDGCDLVYCLECTLETVVPEKYTADAMLGHLMTTDHMTAVREPGSPRPDAATIEWMLAASASLAAD